jgi:hypothetical protein
MITFPCPKCGRLYHPAHITAYFQLGLNLDCKLAILRINKFSVFFFTP